MLFIMFFFNLKHILLILSPSCCFYWIVQLLLTCQRSLDPMRCSETLTDILQTLLLLQPGHGGKINTQTGLGGNSKGVDPCCRPGLRLCNGLKLIQTSSRKLHVQYSLFFHPFFLSFFFPSFILLPFSFILLSLIHRHMFRYREDCSMVSFKAHKSENYFPQNLCQSVSFPVLHSL